MGSDLAGQEAEHGGGVGGDVGRDATGQTCAQKQRLQGQEHGASRSSSLDFFSFLELP